MIETLILHIGQSKTGTSSLQALLSEERDTLSKEGILYPDIMLGGVPLDLLEHNAFAESLSGIMRYPHLQPEAYVQNFMQQMEDKSCHTLLLSAESFLGTPQIWAVGPPQDFFAVHRKKIERLKDLLPAKNCHIVLYLRRQDLWLESAIGHIIRYEGLLGQRIYESDEQISALLAPHLDYLQLVSLWQEVMQPFQFSVVPYEREALRGEDTAQDFLARTGLDAVLKLDGSIPRKLENQSWSAECIELKKILNLKPKSKVKERSIIEILNRVNAKGDFPKTRFSISSDLKDRVWEQHKADNRLLAQTYGAPTGSFFMLPEKHDDAPAAVPAANTMFAVLRQFERLYYAPTRVVPDSLHFLKGFFRNTFPTLYAQIKGIVRGPRGKVA